MGHRVAECFAKYFKGDEVQSFRTTMEAAYIVISETKIVQNNSDV